MIKESEESKNLLNVFLKKFSKEKIEKLTLEEYTDNKGSERDDFTYWIEHKLVYFGSIKGGSSSKFSIYKYNNKPSKLKTDDKYAWTGDFETAAKAFDNVKESLVKLIEWAENETIDYKAIDGIRLGDAYKWKIVFLYSSKEGFPRVVGVYKRDVLLRAAEVLGIKMDNSKSITIGELQKELMKKYEEYKEYKNKYDDIYEYSQFIWRTGGGETAISDTYEILTKYNKQVIIYGAPGTGKTYTAEQTIKEFIRQSDEKFHAINLDDINIDSFRYKDTFDNENISEKKELKLAEALEDKNVVWEIVQFNQSYSYEDFIEGLRLNENKGLEVKDGIFKRFVNVAKQNPKKSFIFIIDEINRGKTDKIFGELLYLLEYRERSVRLHYSNEEFSIPENVYIIGTMNTADKSIALIDIALRRRFWFVRCKPQESILYEKFDIDNSNITGATKNDEQQKVKKIAIHLFNLVNEKLEKEFGNDADELKIGHSYFLKLMEDGREEPQFSDLKNIWFYSIIPLLEEYCGFDKKRLKEICKKDNNIDLSEEKNFTFGKLCSFFKDKGEK